MGELYITGVIVNRFHPQPSQISRQTALQYNNSSAVTNNWNRRDKFSHKASFGTDALREERKNVSCIR